MSKPFIAACEQQGISTPCTIANQADSVKKIGLLLENEFLLPMNAAVEHLNDLTDLFKVIRDMAKSATAHDCEGPERTNLLIRISSLANLGAATADNICDLVDIGHETARDEHVPAILAAVEELSGVADHA